MDNSQEPQGFPERWVRAACVHIYGQSISNTTWWRWRKTCRIPDFRGKDFKNTDHLLTKTYAQWLMCLAFLKYEQRQVTKGGRVGGRGKKIGIGNITKLLNQDPALSAALNKAMGDAINSQGVLGKDAPLWLQKQTGWKPSIATLRRRAKDYKLEFHSDRPLPVKTLNTFLDIGWGKSA